MTLVQLEYIIALDNLKHFGKAAAHCHVTQPSLSMQVQKLEEELGITLFDRSKQPVMSTEMAIPIIEQARRILAERDTLLLQLQDRRGIVAGELRIGIIPTLAPYLLPLFVKSFTKKYPAVRLVIQEMMTNHIIRALRDGKLDAGILVTPLQEAGIKEHVLFYEELLVYVSKKHSIYKKTYVIPQDIKPDSLWLLEEGHCFRSQIVNLCELKKLSRENSSFDYEAGSIETLRRMVEVTEGITIIPELASLSMTAREMELVRHFKKPTPTREVSLVAHRNFMKQKLIELLKKEIHQTIPEKIKNNKPSRIVHVGTIKA
jgi:LysR family hydrogen peroxide-inducible transcriptional activator